jgi:hypothetical protein
MSHIVDIKIKIQSLSALDRACNQLGLELVLGQTEYKWFGRSMADDPLPEGLSATDLGRCTHAIRLNQNHPASMHAYEVGVLRQAEGSYRLLWDFWGKSGKALQDSIGVDGMLLRNEYAAQVAIEQAEMQGFVVSRSVDADGNILLDMEA